MKHIKLFENITHHQSWIDSDDFVLPNICFVTEDNTIVYNPYKGNDNLICTYNVPTLGSAKICNNLSNVQSIIVDGSVGFNDYYNFEEAGEHTVEFVLKDNTLISDEMFSSADYLTSIVIGNNITSIGESAFEGCVLKSIIIPDSVISLGNNVFDGCKSLESITIGNNVTSLGDSIFDGCESLESITIGNNVTSIGNKAFKDCVLLKSITIPNSVTSIGDKAFDDCESLSEIICLGTEPIALGRSAFDSISEGVLKVPVGSNTGLESQLPEGWTVEYI